MSLHPSQVLDDLVASGRESGAAVAVVRDGVVEVDHCAGTRDGTDPWTSDTLVMTFSIAKPFAALALLDAVADGELGLDQPVDSVWPAYGEAGKEGTTVRHLLSHQAGLPVFPEEALGVEYDDRETLVDLLARTAPVHPPGAAVAEHALTYGHLLDEVLRRATGEPLAERFARIAEVAGWDLHLRVQGRDLSRVATLVEVARPAPGGRATSTTRGGGRRWADRRDCSIPRCSTPTASAARRSPRWPCTRRRVPWPPSTTT
ncbi:serine hydrolase domain-containing protein [Nocardioides sediminis]|uniref:serine hydrolase domain-containing protein n=1 Tax=Nocardioides sediminis TaxID=433648 RepID=UPI00131F2378|nr:serine hydrolase domain-containing protein [Nocardioides sediminis]